MFNVQAPNNLFLQSLYHRQRWDLTTRAAVPLVFIRFLCVHPCSLRMVDYVQ